MSSNAIVKAIESVNTNATTAGCTDWCMATFKSYNVISANNKSKRPVITRGYNGASYTVRESDPNSVWQKSALNTDIAYLNSWHIGGSCKATPDYATDSDTTTTTKTSAVVPYAVYDEQYIKDSCQVQSLDDVGFVHHFINMVAPRRSYDQTASKGALVLDEYAQYYWSRVKTELNAIAREEARMQLQK
jgi:hypothetical protein